MNMNMEELSIGQVAKRTGVSARMLRHYDAIGLFSPTRTSGNGYRWYSAGVLPRLYRIVALRRSGLGLDAIARIVADDQSEADTLRGHIDELRAERKRLDALIQALEEQVVLLGESNTITSAKQDAHDDERAAFAERLRKTFGQAAAESLGANPLEQLSSADIEHITAEMRGLMEAFAELMIAEVSPESPEAQAVVQKHHELTSRYWQSDIETYRRMGTLYVTDPLQRSIVASADPRLPEWLAEAIRSFRSLPR